MNTYDIVIAGNGVLGCATALELIRREPTLRIAVVGPRQRPGAASTAAGAMLGCFGEVNHRTLASAPGRAKLDISLRALETWPAWLDQLNDGLPAARRLTIRQGTYVILNSRGGRLDSLNYSAIIEALQAYDRKFEEVPFGTVPELNPLVDARPLNAVFLPDEGAIDARRVLGAVVEVLDRAGVTFLDEEVVGWRRDANRVTAAVTDSGGEIAAGRFLVAAGAASAPLLRQLGDDDAGMPPMLAGKGVAVTCRSTRSRIAHVVRTPNRAGGCGLHLVPADDGTVYLGATNDLLRQPDDHSTIGMAHFLLTCAMEQLDTHLFRSEILHWHVGNRPGTLDGFPLIGPARQENVWVLTGTYRDGFHCSPVLAGHTADTMLGGPGTLGEHCFTALRRPLRTMSSAEAIDEVALHMISQFYEYAARPPVYMQVTDGLERQVRTRTQATYDKLGIDFGLAPELLELLNWGPDREANLAELRRYFERSSLDVATGRSA